MKLALDVNEEFEEERNVYNITLNGNLVTKVERNLSIEDRPFLLFEWSVSDNYDVLPNSSKLTSFFDSLSSRFGFHGSIENFLKDVNFRVVETENAIVVSLETSNNIAPELATYIAKTKDLLEIEDELKTFLDQLYTFSE